LRYYNSHKYSDRDIHFYKDHNPDIHIHVHAFGNTVGDSVRDIHAYGHIHINIHGFADRDANPELNKYGKPLCFSFSDLYLHIHAHRHSDLHVYAVSFGHGHHIFKYPDLHAVIYKYAYRNRHGHCYPYKYSVKHADHNPVADRFAHKQPHIYSLAFTIIYLYFHKHIDAYGHAFRNAFCDGYTFVKHAYRHKDHHLHFYSHSDSDWHTNLYKYHDANKHHDTNEYLYAFSDRVRHYFAYLYSHSHIHIHGDAFLHKH
jgi:hypothetical protein